MARMAIVSVLGAFAMAGCGGGGSGACVVVSDIHPGSWDYCFDGWDQSDCSSHDTGSGHRFSSGKSCGELGFTKHCPNDGPNSNRLPGYTC